MNLRNNIRFFEILIWSQIRLMCNDTFLNLFSLCSTTTWVLTDCTICLHLWRSIIISSACSICTHIALVSVAKFQRNPGLFSGLVPSGTSSHTSLIKRWSLCISMWPAHLNLYVFIVLTMSRCLYSSSRSLFVLMRDCSVISFLLDRISLDAELI